MQFLFASVFIFFLLGNESSAEMIISAPEAALAAAEGRKKIIDIRSRTEWKKTGILEGAHTIEIKNPHGVEGFVGSATALAGNKKITLLSLICGKGERSVKAPSCITWSGFSNVTNIAEGMLGCRGTGLGWLKRGLFKTPYNGCY